MILRGAGNKRMKLTKPPRAACGVACSPFGEHRGFRSLSVCSAVVQRGIEMASKAYGRRRWTMPRIRPFTFAIGVSNVLLIGVLLAAAEGDFDARWRKAQANVKSGRGRQYFNDVFFKEFFGKYTLHVNECTQQTGEKMMDDLKAAVELGATGRVQSVLVRPQSKPAKCFAELVKKDSFSKPPTDHFWIPVEVRFTNR
jgi:hypothetical protein